MEDINIKTLEDLFSKSRVNAYFRSGDTAQELLNKYHVNILLSEAMIPTLSYLEICLRNRIDKVIQTYFGENWLLNNISDLLISEKDINKIKETSLKLYREKKIITSHDSVVAQMTFGFWCSFFHKKYDPTLWHRKDALKLLFPHLPRSNRTRPYIEQKILRIKSIRNRIAHHETIWNERVSIIEVYHMCHELISAISQEASYMLKKIDRFPKVFEGVSLLY